MKSIIKLLYKYSYYLGFLLSLILSYYSYKLAINKKSDLEAAFEYQNSIQIYSELKEQLSRSMMLGLISLSTEKKNLMEAALQGLNSTYSMIDDDKALNLTQELGGKIELMNQSQNQDINEYLALFDDYENASEALENHKEKQKGHYLARMQNFLSHSEDSFSVLKSYSYGLSLFLFILMFLSRHKNKLDQIIEDNERLYRELFASLAEGVIYADAQGLIIRYNVAACQILGINEALMDQGNVMDLLNGFMDLEGKLLAGIESPVMWALSRQEAISGRIVGKKMSFSKTVWISFNTRPIIVKNENGKVVHTLFSFSDLTQKMESDRIIARQQMDLIESAKMSALGQMAGGVAHEINNPMAIIHSEADELNDIASESENVDKNTAQEIAHNIISTSERVSKIIKGLKLFARDGGQDSLSKVALVDLMDDLTGIVLSRFQNSGVSLSVDQIPSIQIMCRETQILQVLVNLLNNSLDAIENLEKKWVKIQFQITKIKLVISVIDSGNGISKEIQDKLFNPFFTTKEVGKGTGLGLSLSLGIIENHKGRLWIDDKCEHTCFKVELPIK